MPTTDTVMAVDMVATDMAATDTAVDTDMAAMATTEERDPLTKPEAQSPAKGDIDTLLGGPVAGPDVEHENLPWHAKGTPQVATTTRANTDGHGRGGATCSSEEGFVMNLEPRGCVIPSGTVHQLPMAGGMH